MYFVNMSFEYCNCCSVSEYLMGDLGNISLEKGGKADKTKVSVYRIMIK
jgi:hypothetical protein